MFALRTTDIHWKYVFYPVQDHKILYDAHRSDRDLFDSFGNFKEQVMAKAVFLAGPEHVAFLLKCLYFQRGDACLGS